MAKSFESSLADLEKIVAQLENGDMPLEESLKLFEAGVKLSRDCRQRLADAERRIEVLMKDGDGKISLGDLSESAPSRSGESTSGKRFVFEDD